MTFLSFCTAALQDTEMKAGGLLVLSKESNKTLRLPQECNNVELLNP